MPGSPACLARSRPAREAATGPSTRRAAVPAAASVNPLRLPKRARALAGGALAPLREHGFAAWLDARRASVAALLLLALDRGWVADAEVHAALDGPCRHERLYGLFGQALRALPGWIETTASRHALDPAQWPDWAPFVAIDLREDAEGARLVLEGCGVWLHTFNLDGLPPALAVAVAHTLGLIGMRLTECGPARDLAELWWEEAQAAYAELRATGLTDQTALWVHVAQETDLLDWFGWRGPEEFAAWWADTAAFCAPAPAWPRRWLAQRHRLGDAAARLRRLTRRLWRWRRRPAVAKLPWFHWLRRAVRTLRRCARRWPEPPACALWLDPEDDSEPLAGAQPLGFGEPWEEDFLQDYDAQAANGSGFSAHLRGDVAHWAGVRDALEAFAIGQGLLIGAVQANDRDG